MAKAIALAVTKKNPFLVGILSAKNILHIVLEFMYGTKQRTNLTLWFAAGLAVIGFILNCADMHSLQYCSY